MSVIKSKYPMIGFDVALKHVVTSEVPFIKVMQIENVEISNYGTKSSSLLNRILAEDVTATISYPPFRASILDGYALCNLDPNNKTYRIIGAAHAGDIKHQSQYDHAELVVGTNVAVYITTGAPVPKDAVCVIGCEHCAVTGDSFTLTPDVPKTLKAGDSIRAVGSDFKQGETLLRKGVKITPASIGMLAMSGARSVKLYKQPRVAILSTGKEVITPHNPFTTSKTVLESEGEIFDANTPMLAQLLQKHAGAVISYEAHCADDEQHLRTILQTINEKNLADFIVCTGGVSMGETDIVKSVLESLGTILFGRANLKPGKPVTAALLFDSKLPMLALPGNPVSAWVCSNIFAVPALRRSQGGKLILLLYDSHHPENRLYFSTPISHSEILIDYPSIPVKLVQDFKGDAERPEYVSFPPSPFRFIFLSP